MEQFNQVMQRIVEYVPNFLGAIAVLVIGWIVAWIIAALIRKLLHRTNVDDRIGRWVSGKEAKGDINTEAWISKGIFYLLMLFVLIAFFQVLNIPAVSEPLGSLLTIVLEFIPKLIAAGILLVLAWILASVLRTLIRRVLAASGIDEKLRSEADSEQVKRVSLSKTLADVVYWLVFLLFLPAILSALDLVGLLEPVNVMLNEILAFLPNMLTAALILVIGWFLARIVQRIVTNLLAAVGADNLGERVGVSQVLGDKGISGAIGLVVFVLIVIPIIIAALNALQLESITLPASNMLNAILGAIPDIFAAALILAVAYVVGKVVCGLISNLLSGTGFDNLLAKLGLSRAEAEMEKAPSTIVGYLVLVAIMLFATMEAASVLGFEALAVLIGQFLVLAGNIILGLIIFGIGLYIANLIADIVRSTDVSESGLLATVAKVSIIILATAMALGQMGLANEIINLAFGLLLGAIAVAVAIAFGLGGRDIAGRKIEKWLGSVESKSVGPGSSKTEAGSSSGGVSSDNPEF